MQILNTDDKTQLIEIKKWFNLQIFKQLDTKYLNALIDKKLGKKSAKKAFKELSENDSQLMYCEYLFEKLPGKESKIYSICNYSLKKDYRNPKVWNLLGRLYDHLALEK